MKRVISATLFLLLALVPMHAQRGARGGGGAAFRGAPAGAYRAAPRSMGVMRSQAPAQRWGGGIGVGYGSYHHRPGRYAYYPYAYGYAYPYAYSAYPFYDLGFYDDYSSYNTNSNSNAYADQELSNEVSSLSQQMQDLRDENDSLRDYIAESRAPAVAPPAPSNAPSSLSQPMQSQEPQAPPTVLVYRDGRTIETRNYAIVGQTLWVLSGQRATKVPLSDLDLDKTKALNEKQGVEFNGPSTP